MWVLLCSQFYVLTIDRTVTLKSEYLLFLIMVYCSTIGQFIIPRSNISSRILQWNRTLVTEIVCFQIFVAMNIDLVVCCIWILTMLFVVYAYWPCCLWYITDVDVPKPDEKSIITYVHSLYDVFPDVPSVEQSLKDNVSIIHTQGWMRERS